MFWCRGKRGEDLGQGSSVRAAMVMAVPVTLEGGKEVRGHRLQRMVQLSPWRPRHLAAAKSYVHRKGRERRGGVGGAHQPLFFHSSSSSLLESQAGVGASVETIHAPFAATGCLEPQESITVP